MADWDKWLPFLLFANLGVPQALTGFSPFELLYGREVRGPLDMLKQNWVAGETMSITTSIISYILQMLKLEMYRTKVREHGQDTKGRV